MKKFILFCLTLLIITATPISAQENRNQIREEVKTNIATSSAKRTELKERVQTRIEEFKAKIAQIKDERKQKIAERVNTQMAHLNQQITTRFTNTLIRLRALLDKLSARSEKVEVKAAIETASGLIVKAEESVQVQASKDYTIVFNDETDLKAGASTAKQQLKGDLETVRAQVTTAHQAVVDVLQMLKEAV